MRRLLFLSLAVAIASGCARPSTTQATATPTPASRPVTFVTAPDRTTTTVPAQHKQAGKSSKSAPSQQQTEPPHGSGMAVIANEPQVLASGGRVQYAPQSVNTLSPDATAPPMIVQPPDAPPQILAVRVDKPVVHPGDTVSADVTTSSNVASVEARLAGRSAVFDKVGEGRFELAYQVPNVPFFLRSKTYMIQVIARNTAGLSVSTAVPISIR